MPALLNAIGPELLSHAEPYQDELRDPDYADEIRAHYEDDAAIDRILAISTPEQALAAATIEGVEIGPDGATMVVLIKMAVPWDVEHTVGAFFQDWRFAELNASV